MSLNKNCPQILQVVLKNSIQHSHAYCGAELYRSIQNKQALTGMRALDLKAATLLRSSSLHLKGTANTVG